MFDVELYLIDLKSKFEKIDKSKYFLSYSGGRDSHFLYWFIKEYLKDNTIEIVGCNTFLEHPQIRDRIIKNCDVILYPKVKPMDIKEKHGIPCFTKSQDEIIERYMKGNRSETTLNMIHRRKPSVYNINNTANQKLLNNELHKVSKKCCDYFKKKPMKEFKKKTGKCAILGVRSAEGYLRKNYKSCFHKNGNFTPIHDLSNELLDEIYKKYDIEIPEIYNHLARTGCMGCPYGHNIEKELALITNDNQRKFIIDYFKESYDVKGINYNDIQQILL